MNPAATVPAIDLGGPQHVSAAALDQAFQDYGFCILNNSGLDPATLEGAFDASRRFHEQSQDEKDRLAINQWHRGYIAPGSSTIRSSSVARVTRPNTSESFMVMQEVAPEDPSYGKPLRGPNQWPADLPGFRPAVEAYRAAARSLGERLLEIASEALDLDPKHLKEIYNPATEFLRFLHYPAPASEEPSDSFGSAPHTDHGFLTLVAQDGVSGLEVKTPTGQWIPAEPEAGALVVNVGDLLTHYTAGRWRSSPHRVKLHGREDRYSIAYFYDPAMAAEITPPAELRGAPDDVHATINYGDYVISKFDRNYGYRRGLDGRH